MESSISFYPKRTQLLERARHWGGTRVKEWYMRVFNCPLEPWKTRKEYEIVIGRSKGVCEDIIYKGLSKAVEYSTWTATRERRLRILFVITIYA